MEQLNFSEVLNLLLLATVLVQSAMVYRSVPRESWDNFLNKATEVTEKTPNALDNKVLRIVRDTVNPLFDRIGVFDKEAVIPATTTTTTTTVSAAPFADDKLDNDLSVAG
jgi:hypothetical protein